MKRLTTALIVMLFVPHLIHAQDIESMKAGIVKVTARLDTKTKVGTGFIVRLETDAVYVVTAAHVIEGYPDIQLTFNTEPAQMFTAKVVGMEGGDPKGLAVLVLQGKVPRGLRALRLDETTELKSGAPLTIIGFPSHLATPWTVVEGTISGFKGRELTFQAPVEEGNSGGPLLMDGKVVGIITEGAGAFGYAANVLVAGIALKGWGVAPNAELDSPVSLSGFMSNTGWTINIDIAEDVAEISYRVGDAPSFKSTGFSPNLDQRTRLPRPLEFFDLNYAEVQDVTVIDIKYRDTRGREKGPYRLTFKPKAEHLQNIKQTLNHDTAENWLSFGFSSGRLLVYFSHLVGYRDGIREIRYSLDNDTLSQTFPLKPWTGTGTALVESDTQILVEVPLTTRQVNVRITYLDGTQSSVKRFVRPKGLGADEGVAELKELLASNPGAIRAKDDDGQTQLHRAAKEGRVGAANLLLAAGAEVDARDKHRRTPLHCAADEGHAGQEAVARLLLANKAEVNAKDEGQDTPLHLAVRAGTRTFVELLIANKGDVNAVGGSRDTPLHRVRSTEVAQVLLAKGAQVDARNDRGWTPLHEAASDNRQDLAATLLANKADIDARDGDKETPLHVASEQGHDDMVRWLLASGADANAKDDGGNSPLYVAASNGHSGVVELLLAAKADVNAAKSYGSTALHAAATKGYVDIVRLLLKNGADVNARNSSNATPLYNAAEGGHADVVQALLEKGADVSVKSYYVTPLHVAASRGHADIILLLLANKADPNTKSDVYEETALHMAAAVGHVDVVRSLLNHRADVNAKNHDGETPLHVAAMKGRADVAKVLLASKADMKATDRRGRTPLDIAVAEDKVDVVALLRSRGASDQP